MPIPSSKTDFVNIVIKFFDNFIYNILTTYTLFLTHPEKEKEYLNPLPL